ncbi:putative bifunctional chitinase/lysozyme [Mycobacterium simulans]|uniref:Putative bifunctional chitinase/lysozyme n=1 Tax=Mycobacterium simulans TaxID=627089 RepID=A0A7Z7IJZ7_9MYCO|nr:cellulose binding domain-containing protein [Mycobacterium simulans]SOJ53936.1 putative bifunctional chitinase/lysozyme [Mycobacterium simulans]
MAYVVAVPEVLASAAADLEGIGRALRAVSAVTVASTTGLMPAAADEVSASIAALFGRFGQEYQSVNAQVAAFQARIVQTLTGNSQSYATAEATNASPLQGVTQEALSDTTTPTGGGSSAATSGVGTTGGSSGGGVTTSAAASGTATTSGGTTGGSTVTTSAVAGGATTGGATGIGVTYAVGSQWNSGFVASYTIKNSGTTPLTNWQLEFDLPANESITSLWSGQIAQSGTHYVVTPESWTRTIAPGGSVTVGFEASHTGAYSPPTNLVVNGEPVSGGGTSGGGTTGGGTTGGGTTGGGTTGGGTSGGGTSGGGTAGVASGEFSPYIDMTLWPPLNDANAANLANAGVDDATLAFIVSGAGNQPAWGGVYSLTDPIITSQIAALHGAGIDTTISFGGANGVDLAYSAPNATVLAEHYESVVNTFGIHKLDFDVEGGMQANIPVLTKQAQAIAMLQAEQAALGTPVEVSYTLPVLPTGLTNDGLGVLQIAKANGVNITRVNIMAMDYGEAFHGGGSPDMGDLAIMSAQSVHGQLMAMDPSLTSEQAWSMIGVTPMIGINDVMSEVFTVEDAHQLVAFADQHDIGELGMWSVARDTAGQLGVVGPNGSGVPQTPYEYSQAFAQFDGTSGDGGGTTGGGTTGGGTSGGDTGGGTTGGGTTGGDTGGGTTGGGTTGGGTTGGTTGVGATYAVGSQWDSGFVASYTITNSGTTPLTNWQLEFDLPANESITSLWSGQVAQSGTHYVVTPESWTQTIAPGGSVTVGFQASQTGAYSAPTNVVVNGQPVSGGTSGGGTTGGGTTGGGTTGGGTTGGGTTGGGTTGGGTTGGGTTGGGTSGGSTGGTTTGTWGAPEFSPYVDMTLWPQFDFAGAGGLGDVDHVVLGFITADSQGQAAWGGFDAYAVNGGSLLYQINDQITAMHNAGIDATISFGGAANQELALVTPDVNALVAKYQSVMDAYGFHKLDFDIEGAAQGDVASLTRRAQAITMLQTAGEANGTPVEVSFTLPVLPTGLTADGMRVVTNAIANGVDIAHVNIMAMDYFDPSLSYEGKMGDYAIQAATAVHDQLVPLYPTKTDAEIWAMIDVTPMIGVNDNPVEIFTLADAQKLTTFAEEKGLGGLHMWSINRDYSGPVGVLSNTSSGVSQSTFAYSQIFGEFDD